MFDSNVQGERETASGSWSDASSANRHRRHEKVDVGYAAGIRLNACRHVRSASESIALDLLRIVLWAFEYCDEIELARAHDIAEGRYGRRRAVELVRAVSALARKLRSHRQVGFCFLPNSTETMTIDEAHFIDAIQAAIDGNSIALDAASSLLLQSDDYASAADDLKRLSRLILGAGGAPSVRSFNGSRFSCSRRP